MVREKYLNLNDYKIIYEARTFSTIDLEDFYHMSIQMLSNQLLYNKYFIFGEQKYKVVYLQKVLPTKSI
jgi:hypothetical protein